MKPIVLTPLAYKDFKPKEYGTYLVIRKDGKCHKEVWNTTGFAYNDKVIEYFYIPKLD